MPVYFYTTYSVSTTAIFATSEWPLDVAGMEDNLSVNVREYQELAKKELPKMHYDYFSGGAEDEYIRRDNIAAYGRILYCSPHQSPLILNLIQK